MLRIRHRREDVYLAPGSWQDDERPTVLGAPLAAVGFAEDVAPLTGEPSGSPDQSWTAAVALDWLVGERPAD